MIRIVEPEKWYKVDRSCTVGSSDWKNLRRFILERDNFTCQYCKTKQGPFEADHILPRAKGGLDTEKNLVCSCQRCNRSKGAKNVDEWRATRGKV